MFDDQPNATPSVPPNLPAEPEDMFAEVHPAEMGGAEASTPPNNALAAGLLKPKVASSMADTEPASSEAMPGEAASITYATKEPVLGKILLIFGIIAGVGLMAFGGWWIYQNYFSASRPSSGAPPSASAPTPEEGFTPSPSVEVPPAQPTAPVTATTTVNAPTTSEEGAAAQNKSILFGEQTDSDQDGLTDAEEAKYSSNMNNPDTDGDGLTDAEEVNSHHTDPTKDDSDADGLSDFDEVKIWHTDPMKADTDGDTFPDGVEVHRGYNPLGPGKLFNVPTSTNQGSAATNTPPATSSNQ